MAEIPPKGLKTLWEKVKLLLMSNFSFSHIVSKRLELQTRKNQGLFGKGLTLYHTILPFKNIVGKGQNACNQHFLHFPQCFLCFLKQISILKSHLFCCLECFNLDQSEFLSFGKDLILLQISFILLSNNPSF